MPDPGPRLTQAPLSWTETSWEEVLEQIGLKDRVGRVDSREDDDTHERERLGPQCARRN